jgi:hypothetical protein
MKALLIGDGSLGGNYAERLAAMVRAGMFSGLEAKPYRLVIRHEDGCPIFKGRACSCEPEFTLEAMA